jgi:hypothetical protein
MAKTAFCERPSLMLICLKLISCEKPGNENWNKPNSRTKTNKMGFLNT